jgi:glutamyl-tRNA synthetase
MHLGNVFAALIAWLSVRSQGGAFLLRMEDLDIQRTNPENARLLRDDLLWLGLDWDEETQSQSQRYPIYNAYFEKLNQAGLLFPCYCSRAQLHSVNAPHASDGSIVYPGTCRDLTEEMRRSFSHAPSWRIRVPDKTIAVRDLLQGNYEENLAADCGDFVLRRSDGLFVYQLAVTVDDALSGVTEVVRGADLLSSTPRQMYLQELFSFPHPTYGHVPLLIAPDGRRLSKRDRDMDLGYLRTQTSPEHILGVLAHAAGLIGKPENISAKELAGEFSWKKLQRQSICLDPAALLR